MSDAHDVIVTRGEIAVIMRRMIALRNAIVVGRRGEIEWIYDQVLRGLTKAFDLHDDDELPL